MSKTSPVKVVLTNLFFKGKPVGNAKQYYTRGKPRESFEPERLLAKVDSLHRAETVTKFVEGMKNARLKIERKF
jgi:hypothetical protein